jgi:hypothetical protein
MEISENVQHQPVTQEFHPAIVTSGANLVKLFFFVIAEDAK